MTDQRVQTTRGPWFPWFLLVLFLILAAAAELWLEPTGPAPPTPTPPRAPAEAWLLGVVLDWRSDPVPYAKVRVEPLELPLVGAMVRPDGEVESKADARGFFRLEPGPGPYLLVAQGKGLGTRSALVLAPDPVLYVSLGPGAGISGRLVGFTGEPRVFAAPLARGWGSQVSAGKVRDDGTFTIDGLELGLYRVWARDRAGSTAVEEPVRAGAKDLVLEAVAKARVSGLVLDGRDAAEVPDALVEISGSGMWPPAVARTDSLGRYGFDEVPEGWYVLHATAGSRCSGFIHGVVVTRQGGEHTLVLEPCPELVVRVTGPGGGPVPGALVTVGARSPGVMMSRGVTGPDGAVSFGPMPPGTYLYTVRAEGYPPIVDEPAPAAAGHGRQVVSLALEPGSTARGIVLSPGGEPVAGAVCVAEGGPAGGAAVDLPRAGRVRCDLRAWLGLDTRDCRGVTMATLSDQSGRFTLSGLPAGVTRVVCSARGFLPGLLEGLRLAPGGAARGLEVRLRDMGQVSGRVVDLEGDGVANAMVRVPGQGSTTSDRHGFFRLWGIARPGRLVVAARGFAPVARDVSPGASDLLLILGDRVEPIEGQVLGPEGRAIEGVTITLTGAGGLSVETSSREGGWFRFDSPPPGPWTARAVMVGMVPWTREFPIGTRTFDIHMRRGGSLVLELLEQGTFEPLPRVSVRLEGPTPVTWQGSISNGFLALDHLAPGRYRGTVAAPGHVATSVGPLQVTEGGETGPVRLMLQPGGRLGGHVTDLDGRPLRRVEILATSPLSSFPEVELRTDRAGRFMLPWLPEGPVVLRFEAKGFQPHELTDRIVTGETYRDLEVKLLKD